MEWANERSGAGAKTSLISGFVLTLFCLPQLGCMVLLLPLFPSLMVVLPLMAGLLNQVWGYALGATLFCGCLLAAGLQCLCERTS